MTSRPIPQTIDQWLSTATHGLPGSITPQIRDELKSHFDDAVEDYQMHGKSAAESEQAALVDLGDAGATSKALRETHLARRWYIAGMIVGLMFPVLLWLALGPIESSMPYALSRPIGDLLILSPTFFILYVFGRFMARRTESRAFDGPVICLVAAMILSNGAIDLRLALFPGVEDTLWIVNSGPGVEWAWLGVAGLIGISLGMFWLVFRLLALPDALYGLRAPLVVVGAVLALSVMGFGVGLLQGALSFAVMSDMVAMAMDLVIIALMALLFFRAAYRPSGRRVHVA